MPGYICFSFVTLLYFTIKRKTLTHIWSYKGVCNKLVRWVLLIGAECLGAFKDGVHHKIT